jgi:hypothetical protein
MKKILIAAIPFFLLLTPSAFAACGYFEILSDVGVPVFNSMGYALINSSNYPANQKMILYNFTIKNDLPPRPLLNIYPVGVNLTFVPTGDLINYVYGTTGHADAYTVNNISMYVYIDGYTREDVMFVSATCSDGYRIDGTIPIKILGRGNGPPPACPGSVSSCGVYPNCVNLYTLNGCYNGYYRVHSCLNNAITYTESCTSYCCGLTGGTCLNAGKCSTGSSTTTTIPGTTTSTTIPSTTTTIPSGTSGCQNGMYRNYYFSGGQWQYNEMCTSYCCGLIGGTCGNGRCNGDPQTTTTTTSATTTTLPGSTTTSTISTTTTIPSGTSGCQNGMYRNYYFSGGQWQYSEMCTNYCCSLVHGTCLNGVCSGSPTSTTTTIPSSTTTTTVPSTCTNAYAASLNGCYYGYYRNYYCTNSHMEYSEMCTSYCCNLFSGKCQSGTCFK